MSGKNAEPTLSECDVWLLSNGAVPTPDTSRLLLRASAPVTCGLTHRTALPLPPVGTQRARDVVRLLSTGTTPTAAALDDLERGRMHRAAKPHVRLSVGLTDQVGRYLADYVDSYWDTFGVGPTWTEMFRDVPNARDACTSENAHLSRSNIYMLMSFVLGRGWLATTTAPRSTCAGPTYFASQPNKVRVKRRLDVGERVAHYIGKFTSMQGRPPTWSDLVPVARYWHGGPIFRSQDDARRQARWLISHGWVTEAADGSLSRGSRAHELSELRRTQRDLQRNLKQAGS